MLAATLAAAVSGRAGQAPDAIPLALEQILDADRTFAARALAVGWRQASLEHLALDAVAFGPEGAAFARPLLEVAPDPPAGHRRVWEARYGDVASSGDLGYVTGAVEDVAPDGVRRTSHSVYLRIWKRQRDSAFRMALDLYVPTPRAPTFAEGFTRAPHPGRFTEYDDSTPPLGTADGLLNAGLRTNQARAYRLLLAPGVRFHRPNANPVVGERSARTWLAGQAPFSSADTRYSESSRSGDLGYTWGAYTGARPGFYVRVWVRERSGQWNIALDLLHPQ